MKDLVLFGAIAAAIAYVLYRSQGSVTCPAGQVPGTGLTGQRVCMQPGSVS